VSDCEVPRDWARCCGVAHRIPTTLRRRTAVRFSIEIDRRAARIAKTGSVAARFWLR
jgi:hypothetical protein